MHALKVAWRLVMISRPISWSPAVAVFVGGYLLGNDHMSMSWYVVAGALYCTIPMGVIVYGINDIADRESDALNPRKGDGGVGVVLQRSDRKLLNIGVPVCAIAWPLLFAVSGRYLAAASLLVITLFAYVYSAKPFRLKVRPVADSLSNGLLWVLPIFLFGNFVNATGWHAAWPDWRVAGVIVLCAAAAHAITAAMDYDIDKRVRDVTIAVALGVRGALYFALTSFLLSFYLLHDRPTISKYTALCALATAAALLHPVRKAIVWLAYFTIGAVLFLMADIVIHASF